MVRGAWVVAVPAAQTAWASGSAAAAVIPHPVAGAGQRLVHQQKLFPGANAVAVAAEPLLIPFLRGNVLAVRGPEGVLAIACLHQSELFPRTHAVAVAPEPVPCPCVFRSHVVAMRRPQRDLATAHVNHSEFFPAADCVAVSSEPVAPRLR